MIDEPNRPGAATSAGPEAPRDSTPEQYRVEELAQLGVLTASLLHELRQPLFAIKGRLQLARRSPAGLQSADTEDLAALVDHVEELVEHYAGLGRTDDSWSDVDVSEAVQRALRMLAARIRQANVSMRVDLAAPNAVIRCRAVALRQIVLNLVSNAIDAAATGQTREVRIAVLDVEGRTRVTVSDSGGGVSAATRARIFEPFFSTKGPERGTGLGLYIARRLVEEAGGTLSLAPFETGRGAALTAEFPARWLDTPVGT